MLLTRFLQIISLLGYLSFQGCVEVVSERQPPNIIIIFTDDQGYNDLACFGSPDIKTPHLDWMAKEGAKFTEFYAAQPVCSASRAALLTGCYPNRLGIHGALMPNSKIGLNHDEVSIAEMLKDKGYNTAIFGKWHLGDHPEYLPLNHGFDEFFGIPYSNDMWPNHPLQGNVFDFPPLPLIANNEVVDTVVDQSNLTIEITKKSVDFINRNKDNPFFLYVPHPQPHVPLYVSDKFKGQSERGLYGDVIMELDWSVGQITEAVKNNGIEDNTLIIFTSDNGPWLAFGNHAGSAHPLREGKGTSWEGGLREPFIIKYPPLIKAGSVINTPIMAIDILPTIAQLCNAQLPDHPIDGKSILDIISGKDKNMVHEAYYFYYKTNELHAVRSRKWKLYLPHAYRTMQGQTPGKDGLPGQYKQVEISQPELYDIVEDPSETKNVYSFHPEVVKKLDQYAETARKKFGDKLTSMTGIENREPGIISDL